MRSDYWRPTDSAVTNNSPRHLFAANTYASQLGDLLMCEVLERLIPTFLDTPQEKALWQHYVNGHGISLRLSCENVLKIAESSSPPPEDVTKSIENAGQYCRDNPGAPPFSDGTNPSAGSPWAGGLGTYTARVSVKCDGCCATVYLGLYDVYDFNILGANRPLAGQLKTMGVELAGWAFKCDWTPYEIFGVCEMKSCPAPTVIITPPSTVPDDVFPKQPKLPAEDFSIE